MQSGTTGINTLRIYNPTKQAVEQDPRGVFIRRWVPELARVPPAYVHMPWTMPADMQQGQHEGGELMAERQAGEADGNLRPRPRDQERGPARILAIQIEAHLVGQPRDGLEQRYEVA